MYEAGAEREREERARRTHTFMYQRRRISELVQEQGFSIIGIEKTTRLASLTLILLLLLLVKRCTVGRKSIVSNKSTHRGYLIFMPSNKRLRTSFESIHIVFFFHLFYLVASDCISVR